MARPIISPKPLNDAPQGWAVVESKLVKGGWRDKVLIKDVSLTAARQIAAILKEDR